VGELVAGGFEPRVRRVRALLDAGERPRAELRALAVRLVDAWPDARAAVLWDGSVALFSRRGLVLTDVCAFGARATGAVVVFPVEAILRIERTQREDPARRVCDLNPAAGARALRALAPLGGPLAGGRAFVVTTPVQPSAAAVVWDALDIATRDPLVGNLRLEFCCDAAGAVEIERTLAGGASR
jgi:hypothetical protein